MVRMKWIDTTKGIAIIFVVIGHVVSSYHSSGMYIDSPLFQFSHDFAYSFHMPLFMLLSGLLFSYSHITDKSASIKQKILNYGIPYVFFSFLWWGFKMILASHANTALSFDDLFRIPLYPISFMWYIYALLWMQIIQIALENLGRKTQIVHVVVAFSLLIAARYLKEILISIAFEDLIICDIFNFYVYFLIGVYFGKDAIAFLEKHSMKLAVLFSGVILIGYNIMLYFDVVNDGAIVKFVIALIGSIFIIAIGHLVENNRCLNYLGRESLAIYVLHGLAIAGTRSIITRMWHWSDIGGLIPMVLCTFFGIVLPLVAYELSTRIWKFDFFFSPGKYVRVKKSGGK